MHVNAFPPEILVNIFEQGKSSPACEIGGSTLLFTVSQVCAAWRAIAHGYPFLWDDLRLSARSSPQKAKNLIARYKGPTIAVTVDRSTTPPDPIAYWNMLNAVTAQAVRLRSLRFIGPAASLRLFSRACVRYTFPRLRDLVFIESAAVPDQGVPPHISIEAPNVASLAYTRMVPLRRGNYPRLRELQLEDSAYFVHFDQPDGFVEQQLLELQVLSITASPLPLLRNPSLCPTDSNIVSLKLCGLRTADIAPDSLAGFFRIVRMPLLRRLEVSGLVDYLLDEFIHSLAPTGRLPPRYPVLKSLTLRSLSLAEIDGNSLHAVQSVSKMRLVDLDPRPLVHILERDHRVCPNVREIRLGNGVVLRLRSGVSPR
ncbi:hypothetical protein B0H17DRAFT_648676 [Mycena rosella]|uniref:F-box domain-containing protein n=1 Tax=Mycena rosella TaxID=1033263 RepID=A0AAD7DDE4_MYCRO|nr:hypothetical protein B0H17DRAFT_648676 [Mycena rosella]